MSKPRIVVVGSSNMDLIAYVPTLPKAGETIVGSEIKTGCGGKGANQAVMAALLEADVAFVGKIGDDVYGTQMKENFKKFNIDITHLSTVTNTASGLAPIFVSATGENCIVVVPGANNLITLEEVRNATNTITSANILLVQLEIPLPITIEALKIATQAKVTTILNTAPAKNSLPEEIYQYIDFVCANETELNILTGLPVNNVQDMITGAKVLLDKGASQVIVTMGELGSLYVTKDKDLQVPCYKSKEPVIDTSGAGDCYLGSFAYFLGCGFSVEECMEKASLVAGISVTRYGTQTSYPERVKLPESLFK